VALDQFTSPEPPGRSRGKRGSARRFILGFSLSLVVAAVGLGAVALFSTFSRGSAVQGVELRDGDSRPASGAIQATFSGETQQTVATLNGWLPNSGRGDGIKDQVMGLAIAYFGKQTGQNRDDLAKKVVFLSSDDYGRHSASSCQDSKEVNPPSEAWLLQVVDDRLYVNSGFRSPPNQTVTELFFRYLIGLYNAAPPLKSYPQGTKAPDGTTIYYEKGLLALSRSNPADAIFNRDCFLIYRLPVQQGFTAYAALRMLQPLGLTPSPAYSYPQKKSLDVFRQKVAPALGNSLDALTQPFLASDSAGFYRRAGQAVSGSAEPGSQMAAADKLFRDAFPADPVAQ